MIVDLPTIRIGQFMYVTVSMTSVVKSVTMPRVSFPMTILVIPMVELVALNIRSIILAFELAIPYEDVSAELPTLEIVPFMGLTTLGGSLPMVLVDYYRPFDVRVNFTFPYIWLLLTMVPFQGEVIKPNVVLGFLP